MDDRKSDRPKGIQSVEISFRLLKPFLTSAGPFSLKDLARAAGMTPAKAHFYLVSLMRIGLVARSGAGGAFSLGPNALNLGLAALAQVDVVQAAREPMQQLRDTLGAPLFLSVWAENGPTIVQRFQGLQSSAWAMQVGAVLAPLTATGRAFLAHYPPGLQRSIVERELANAVRRSLEGARIEQIMSLLDEIQCSGISPGSGAVVPGFTSVAAAIVDHEGGAAAAITIIGDAQHFDDGREGKYARALVEATRLVSHRIGGRAKDFRPAALVDADEAF